MPSTARGVVRFLPLLALIAFASVGLARPATAGVPGFIVDDVQRAQGEASRSGKYLLLEFTGSDWCPPCRRLKAEVFQQNDFQQWAKQNLVLASLDFPRSRGQTAAVKKTNREWAQRLGVTGYPSIYLADAQGRPFAKTGYRSGGAGAYVRHLEQFIDLRRQQERVITAAGKLEGLDRVRKLGEVFDVRGIMLPEKDEVLAEIRRLDPEDTVGLIAKHGGGKVAPAGEKDPDANLTPFQRDLKAARALIADRKHTEAARAVRKIQQAHKPRGADLADWSLLRMDLMVAIDRVKVAMATADRVVKNRSVPAEARQRVLGRKAELMLAGGDGDGALEAWDAAIQLASDSATGKALTEGRAAFAARCRNATRSGGKK